MDKPIGNIRMGNGFESISHPEDENDLHCYDRNFQGTKVVFQGTQNSGKDLLFRQIKYIFNQDSKFDKEFIKMMAFSALANVICACFKKCETLFPETSEKSDYDDAIFKLEHYLKNPRDLTKFEEQTYKSLITIWKDQNIQKCYQNMLENDQVTEYAQYLLRKENLKRLNPRTYTPSFNDYVHSRFSLYGVEEFNINIKGRNFHLLQYGDMPQNRKRLSKIYLKVKLIVYVVDISGYCKKNIELVTANELEESIMISKEIADKDDYKDSNFVLVYNNVNTFKELIKKKSLKNYCEKYKHDDNFESSIEYITNELKSKIGSDRIISIQHVEVSDKESILKLYQNLEKIFMEIEIEDEKDDIFMN